MIYWAKNLLALNNFQKNIVNQIEDINAINKY